MTFSNVAFLLAYIVVGTAYLDIFGEDIKNISLRLLVVVVWPILAGGLLIWVLVKTILGL